MSAGELVAAEDAEGQTDPDDNAHTVGLDLERKR